MSKKRKLEIYKNGCWQHTSFKRLQRGDKFRIIEPFGEYYRKKDRECDLVCTQPLHKNLKNEEVFSFE